MRLLAPRHEAEHRGSSGLAATAGQRMDQKVTLPGATLRFFHWLQSVIAEFNRADPQAARGSIACIILQRVFNLLAFFLPLKVILLLGSDGVPAYFRGFVSEATRDLWIWTLAVASVIFYGLSLLCEAAERRYAATGSSRVLKESNQLSLLRDQDNVARGYFSRFCTVQAHVYFALILGLVILFLFPVLFGFLVALLAVEWGVATLSVGDLTKDTKYRLGAKLRGGVRDALAVVASVNFLLVFAFLVAIFLYWGGVNLLIAILSILLVRQLFGSIRLVVAEGVRLSQQAERANALIFRNRQMSARVPGERARFYENFGKGSRDRLFSEMLGVGVDQLDSRYLDRVRPAVSMFDIHLAGRTGVPDKMARCLVHHPSASHLVVHEAILFDHVENRLLKRDARVLVRDVEGFMCRVFDWGGHTPVKANNWDLSRRELLVDFWSVAPCRDLVDIYQTSRPLLHQRFTAELLSRMEVAIDTSEERLNYEKAQGALPEIQAAIRALPLFVDNRGLAEAFTLHFEDRPPLVLNWDRWELAPVGVGLGAGKRDLAWFEGNCDSIIARLARQQHAAANVTPSRMLLAAIAADIETNVLAGMYKRSLGQLSQLCRSVDGAAGSNGQSFVAK